LPVPGSPQMTRGLSDSPGYVAMTRAVLNAEALLGPTMKLSKRIPLVRPIPVRRPEVRYLICSPHGQRARAVPGSSCTGADTPRGVFRHRVTHCRREYSVPRILITRHPLRHERNGCLGDWARTRVRRDSSDRRVSPARRRDTVQVLEELRSSGGRRKRGTALCAKARHFAYVPPPTCRRHISFQPAPGSRHYLVLPVGSNRQRLCGFRSVRELHFDFRRTAALLNRGSRVFTGRGRTWLSF
jgi:hypothetical protein